MNGIKDLSIRLTICVFPAALAGPAAAVTYYVNPGDSIQTARKLLQSQ